MSFPPTERQARLIWLTLSGLSLAALAALVVGLVWGLGRIVDILAPVLWPLAVAGVLAYLLDPVVNYLQRKRLKRPRAIILVFVLGLVLLAGLCASIVPQIVTEARQLTDRIPTYATVLEQRVAHWIENPPPLIRQWLERNSPAPVEVTKPVTTVTNLDFTITNRDAPHMPTNIVVTEGETNKPSLLSTTLTSKNLETAATQAAKAVRDVATWLVGHVVSWFGVLAGLALIPVYTFYFLLEKDAISSRWSNYLPVSDSRFKSELVFVLNSINNYLITFFRGQVLVAITDGILYGLGFLLIGLPYALVIGAMAMVLTLIPFLGAIIVCVTALIIALVQFGNWQEPLLVLAVFGVVQTLEGLVISPKIMGGRVGLHPLTIIIAVMVGTTLLGGLLGGILAIPLTAALRVVMFRYIWKRPSAEVDVKAL
jgi:predicted PurR-regulated permease PerM